MFRINVRQSQHLKYIPGYFRRFYQVLQVPIFDDNYSHVIFDEKSNQTIAVDPADSIAVMNATKEKGWPEISTILITHKHHDHTGGNEDFSKNNKCIEIIGPEYEEIPYRNKGVKHGDSFKIGLDISVDVIHTPCHTSGHVSFLVTSPRRTNPSLFCGDTLFVGGCGRFFEGTASDMLTSLNRLRNLEKNTEVYCGHEYTLSNLKFALTVDPNNEDLKKKFQWVLEQRRKKLSTVPSTLEEELSYNPFLRTQSPQIRNATGAPEDALVMKILRKMKDNFR